MRSAASVCAAVALAAASLSAQAGTATRARVAEPAVFDAVATEDRAWRTPDFFVLMRAQVLLDRAHFSPGEIDGKPGKNLERALRAFQNHRKLTPTGQLDEQTWASLHADTGPALAIYTLGQQEVAGPFMPVPQDMMEKARLKTLSWSSREEALGEQFHLKPAVLKLMNPGAAFNPGDQITVPNVGMPAMGKAVRVRITTAGNLTALDEAGQVIAHFPCTSGSEHDPLPLGTWTVTKVYPDPEFHYNPKLFWDADPGHSKAKVAPGPNNPVGVVWIDITKEHYGIHGTPAPSAVGHAQSHGCIRLTNWDARELAGMVGPGTEVLCEKE